MTREQIARRSLEKRLNKYRAEFDKKIWPKIVEDINAYISKYGSRSDSNLTEDFCDHLCLSGAWMYDRIQGRIATTHNPDYRGSMTKKIRKALGYNL